MRQLSRYLCATLLILCIAPTVTNAQDGWIINPDNGHWYRLSSEVSYWATAQAEAQTYGGNLVTIRNDAEQQWLADNFGATGVGRWIGMFQEEGSEEPAGGWSWISGEPVTYTAWLSSSGAPNNSGSWDGTGRQENVGIMLSLEANCEWEDYSDQPYIYNGLPQLDHAKGIIEVFNLPEPTTLGLLTIGGLAMIRRCRTM